MIVYKILEKVFILHSKVVSNGEELDQSLQVVENISGYFN